MPILKEGFVDHAPDCCKGDPSPIQSTLDKVAKTPFNGFWMILLSDHSGVQFVNGTLALDIEGVGRKQRNGGGYSPNDNVTCNGYGGKRHVNNGASVFGVTLSYQEYPWAEVLK